MDWALDTQIIATGAKYLGIAITAGLGIVGTVTDTKKTRADGSYEVRPVGWKVVAAIIVSSIIGSVGQYYDDREMALAQSTQISRLRKIGLAMNRFSGRLDVYINVDITHAQHRANHSPDGQLKPTAYGPRVLYMKEILSRPCVLWVLGRDGRSSYQTTLTPDKNEYNVLVLPESNVTLNATILLHSGDWAWNSKITSVDMFANTRIKIDCGNKSAANTERPDRWQYSLRAAKLLDGASHLYLGSAIMSRTDDDASAGRLIMPSQLTGTAEDHDN